MAIYIALHRNANNGSCYPSQRKLATLTGYPQRTIANTISRLRSKHIFTTHKLTLSLKSPLNYIFQFDAHVLQFIEPPNWLKPDTDTIDSQAISQAHNNKDYYEPSIQPETPSLRDVD